MRQDDIFIAAYMKCGTHWVAEMLQMLLEGSIKYGKRVKESAMLELVDDLDALSHMPSPRVLNSHLYNVHLPREILEKQVKIIHLLRHPKDVAVSWYYHLKQMGPTEAFTFENYLKGYVQDFLSVSHQFNYLRQMSEFEKLHPDHPIMHVHYEDLKMDPVPIVQEMAKFIGVSASEAFCQEVVDACHFEKMVKMDQSRKLPDNIADKINKKAFYRKGIIGDWKNHFTVAQNEMFDDFIHTQETKGFGYTLKGE
ncbi:hypothetical protein RRG08_048323 [Elysia crispata]|uniref:Sulfotransferase domain-containing protein n=1 Tax=Elysia crispata TaxID=231223 RepID=A0AAE0YIL6_9GAST|nr:hypothetical protein RRG08_048323 [Elysia crispata]